VSRTPQSIVMAPAYSLPTPRAKQTPRSTSRPGAARSPSRGVALAMTTACGVAPIASSVRYPPTRLAREPRRGLSPPPPPQARSSLPPSATAPPPPRPDLASAQPGVHQQARRTGIEVGAIAARSAAQDCKLHRHAREPKSRARSPQCFCARASRRSCVAVLGCLPQRRNPIPAESCASKTISPGPAFSPT